MRSVLISVSPPLSYPQVVMDKIKEMSEGIVVQNPPVHKTTKEEFLAKGKRCATSGNSMCIPF